jgi:hypothetical protein
MSRASDLTTIGWETLLDEHGVAATYTPSGGAAASILVLDNGQPEDVQQLAMGVDGVARIVTATRTEITAAVGATVVIGGTTYYVIAIRPRSDQAVDLLLGATVVASNETGTTYTIYHGTSASLTLLAADITGLENNRVSSSPGGNYTFAITSGDVYCFLAWPNAMADQPNTADGFESGGFVMTGDMAGTSEGYTSTENGWNYQLVTVGGVSYRVYRTLYQQGTSLTITVNV